MKSLHKVPEEFRLILKKPLGHLVANDQVSKETLSAWLEKAKLIVSVGDATTSRMISLKIIPSIQVVDGKVMRAKGELPIKAHAEEIHVSNPAGYISQESLNGIVAALSADKPVRIVVDGEEDLLTLPIIAIYPENSIILYGQPKEGLVIVKIDQTSKQNARSLLKNFGIQLSKAEEKE